MLVGDAFGGFGGLAKFNRDFLTALAGSGHVEHLRVLPRTISEPIEPAMPPSIVFERAAAAGRWSYVWRVFACLLRGDRIDVVVCGHRNLLPVAFALARLRGACLVLAVHGVEAWTPSASRVLNWLSGRIDALLAVSQVSAERFCKWSGFPVDRAVILPNCVDLAHFKAGPKDPALVKKYGLGAGKVIMTVGRILSTERYKGFDQIIDLMPRLLVRFPALKYLVVGDGSDRARLQAKVARMNIADHVVFAGRVAEADKVLHYNLADAYVMPSWGEGFGIVLIEALACGLPVVGSSIDGSRNALLGGELGRLVDPADADAVFKAIVDTLEEQNRGRPRRLDLYSEDAFRDRVALWARQISQTTGRHEQPISSGKRA